MCDDSRSRGRVCPDSSSHIGERVEELATQKTGKLVSTKEKETVVKPTIVDVALALLDAAVAKNRPYEKNGKLMPASKGCHAVYSGWNKAITRVTKGKINPIELVDKLVAEGKLVKTGAKGGVMLYRPENAPSSGSGSDTKVDDLLAEAGAALGISLDF